MKKFSMFITLCFMLFSARYAIAQDQYQEITLIPDNTNPQVGGELSITVRYDCTDNTLPGLGIRIHFDSSKLTYTTFRYIYEDGASVFDTFTIADPQLQDDVGNKDNDISTDKFILIGYQDISGNWPGHPLPSDLIELSFTADSLGNTTLNISRAAGAAGFGFQGTGSEIIISDPDISASLDSHDFGTGNLGESSAPQTLTISNIGNEDLNMGILSLTGTDAAEFTIRNDNCSGKTFPAGESCTIEILFSPSSPGIKTAVIEIPSDDPDTPTLDVHLDAYGYDSDQPVCSLPITQTLLTPTIRSVRDGHWNSTSTWDQNRVPGPRDVVLVGNHKIENLPDVVIIKALCNYGELISGSDRDMEIRAEGGITNYTIGIIRGQDGESGMTRPNSAGKDVILKTASHIRIGRWLSAQNAGPIYNDGQILGGAGTDGRKGGDALILGRNVTNDMNGMIRGGNGGDAQEGGHGQEGGPGGLVQVLGNLGGPGNLISKGTIIAGDGGDGISSGGYGGNLWLVSLPNVYLGVDKTSYITRSTISAHHAGKGGIPGDRGGRVIIEPNLTSIRAGAEISGGDITIFGGDDSTLDFTEAEDAVIQAEGDITLAVGGENSSVDLTGTTGTLLKAGASLKVFANNIGLDEDVTLSDISDAAEIETGPATILRHVSVTGAGQVTGQPGQIVSVRLTLANVSPEPDTYTLTVTDSQDSSLGEPLEVEVEALGALDFDLDLTLPSASDETQEVTITAVSTSDPDTTAETKVRLAAYGIPGDADDNKTLDLGDAILIMKVLTRTDTADVPVYAGADVNGDGNLGVEEMVYVLTRLASAE